jgi:hypothetical protein
MFGLPSTLPVAFEPPPPPAPPRIVWQPLPGSQRLALWCPAHIILYDGTRGPGKTDAQLMRFRRNVGRGYGRFWRGVIFDREYKNLDDLVAKSMRWFPEIAGPKPHFMSSKADYRWRWETGEELLFRVIKRPADYWGYHGQEFFDMMMSCNRSSYRPQDYPLTIDGDEYNRTGQILILNEGDSRGVGHVLPELPLEVFATTNPYGPGHNWVKKRFINAAPAGRIVRKSVNVFNPRTQQRENVVKTQVRLFGSYRENIYLSPEYIAELEQMTDKNKRKAWLGGSWDIVAGGMFDDVWDSDFHVLVPFQLPPTWKIDRSFDWGSSKPFSVGWWAESDGSDVQMPDGTWRSTVRGDLFRVAEWYGTTGKPNQGLRMLANDIAAGIVEREMALGWTSPDGLNRRVQPGPADNSIWDIENGNSIAADMQRPVKVRGKTFKGVNWTRSDKSPGSRKLGWERVRTYLNDGLPEYVVNKEGKKVRVPRERPGLFVFNTCTHFIDLFPTLPRDEDDQDDVDTDSEDHIGDETRYKVLSAVTGARSGRTKGT